MTIVQYLNIYEDVSQLISLISLNNHFIGGSLQFLSLIFCAEKESPMNLLASLGKRIQSVREKQGLTQEQLEEKTGVNTKYISAIERGQKNVTVKTLAKIASGLQIELYEIFLPIEIIGSEKTIKKAIESLLKDTDIRTMKLCLEFLRKAAG